MWKVQWEMSETICFDINWHSKNYVINCVFILMNITAYEKTVVKHENIIREWIISGFD